jgi:hypothetical protein
MAGGDGTDNVGPSQADVGELLVTEAVEYANVVQRDGATRL